MNADWLREAPFTLVLSSGFFGFFAHTGVLLALEDADLPPARVVGTSAGAIAGGPWASGISAAELARRLGTLERAEFWDPVWRGLLSRSERAELKRDPGTSLGLLRGRKFDALLGDMLDSSITHIEDCPVPLAIVTHDLLRRATVVQTRGPIRPAIRASAALPLMFGPVRIDGRLHADGGIGDRPGFSALEAGERCLYHHLPHTSRWPRPSGSDADDCRPSRSRRVLLIPGLPRAGPTALDHGRRAIVIAREHTRRWLAESMRER